MSEPTHDLTQDDDRDARVEERALLLPEEIAAGSDDPEAQAAAILADSDLREEQPGRTQQDSPQSPDLSADD
ncbi:hypothetical protein [Microlunatus flavus]|uniref:Uncharacterized protein n=1 Tax=Microlunatus flavus TaxID=1036181 RepID=A0A1H9MZF9_9ACTN|nr:hypothetical protein [Microlunatus flavus]SER29084.1 hypothetical protein SAMN05421756_11214 [Microlunatus flavus]